MHTVSLVANNYHYMKIYNHDTTFFAAHYGSIVSTNNLCNAFLNPIVGSLSDRFGRRWILAGTRVGWLLWWCLLPRIHTPFQRRLGEVLCCKPPRYRWHLGCILPKVPAILLRAGGILGAGTWTVFGAAYSDRFGDRPELTAQIHAADAVWGSLGHFSGLLLGGLLGRTLGHASTWVASGVLAAALVAVAAATKETLPLDKRKPFTLATANPFSNLWLLFSNGVK